MVVLGYGLDLGLGSSWRKRGAGSEHPAAMLTSRLGGTRFPASLDILTLRTFIHPVTTPSVRSRRPNIGNPTEGRVVIAGVFGFGLNGAASFHDQIVRGCYDQGLGGMEVRGAG